jgi:hypothetical protein
MEANWNYTSFVGVEETVGWQVLEFAIIGEYERVLKGVL